MMQFERRLVTLLLLLAVLGAPALGLRLLCAGHSCDEPVRATADIPFCSLPTGLRELIANGFREGRSPDVLAVVSRPVAGGTFFDEKKPRPQWPSPDATDATRVPIAFRVPGLEGDIPAGTGLDDVAPTIAAILGLERAHPDVRSGRAIPNTATIEDIRLVLQIVWKDVGSDNFDEEPSWWPTARGLLEDFGTLDGRTASLPTDPAAVLTTIGTGGIPAQHGITGALLRDESGGVREAWSKNAPASVIAGLGDDLDELTGQDARVGMVADHPTDRGLIGKDWYVEGDEDDFVVAKRSHEVEDAVERLLKAGYGRDATPDLLAVSLQEPLPRMDKTTYQVVESALNAVGDERVAVVLTTTGSAAEEDALPAAKVARQLAGTVGSDDLVAATAPGGVYLDQQVVARDEVSDDAVLDALADVTDGAQTPVFEDVFPAIAVSFGRYC